MANRTLASLGALVRKQRGEKKLRDVANEIGISPATLMRVENGRTPDVETFGKICQWLKMDPGSFLGFKKTEGNDQATEGPITISAHLRADRTPNPKTLNALAKLIWLATKNQKSTEALTEDENA